VIALKGELGSGKTAFVQGMGRGLNVPENCYITSPTFTLINEYPGRLNLFHIDLYRLADTLEVEDIGLFDIFNDKGVVAIEWAEKIGNDLPKKRMEVCIEITSDHSRTFTFTAYEKKIMDLLKNVNSVYCVNEMEKIWD